MPSSVSISSQLCARAVDDASRRPKSSTARDIRTAYEVQPVPESGKLPAPMGSPKSARPEDVSTEWLLRPEGRPLLIFAHQDDETVLAGMIRRIIGPETRARFVWWTNGDGLAP